MPLSGPSARRLRSVLAAVLLLSGCAGPAVRDRLSGEADDLAPSAFIDGVPFYPQKKYQCGPAALAMILNYAGTDVNSEALIPQVYLPGRHGSLQIDITATTRRYGHVPYIIQPSLHDLLQEIGAGHPVLVLQNLGLGWWPAWHYAVVIGYDLQRDDIILHSGEQREHTISISTFARTWKRAKNWGLVITATDQVPASASQTGFLRGVADLEKMGQWDAAGQGYAAALRRWPDSFMATFGAANIAYHQGQLQAAQHYYQQAIALEPRAIAYHNLAIVYADLDQLDLAEQNALTAIKLGGPLLKTFEQTLRDIQDRKKHPE